MQWFNELIHIKRLERSLAHRSQEMVAIIVLPYKQWEWAERYPRHVKLKRALRKSWLSSKGNKIRSYSSSVVVSEFLFLPFPFAFAFALLFAKHTTEMIMVAPTTVPTNAPKMIPTSGSGRYKLLVGKVECTVCLLHVHLWPVQNIYSIHTVGKWLVEPGNPENSARLIGGEERWLAWLCCLPIHIDTHKKTYAYGGGSLSKWGLEKWVFNGHLLLFLLF